ncbi:conserved hypothetical protein [Culex quinquefasciatus]|uniref:SecA DEAD-like N-terminal domain-containing protein n=1 Tax=Culex quinquefasciatus TaxID=7176 RepID=B0XLX6_CULQU|nr:conserved hypothetical protein [Culex quinquefasciatus]|eukprot:XP_001870647.1 conserved hypothetical protein [Culex quinquefasciatus]
MILFRDWSVQFKQTELPQILARVAAVWAIAVSTDVSSTGKFFKPHCVQILCVLKLLGVDAGTTGVPKHLAQVLTGQGKSLILALIAAVLALTGHYVQIACYNEYLVKRDGGEFEEFYKLLGVSDVVKYGTFEDMANAVVAPEVDGKRMELRTFVQDMILSYGGGSRPKKPKPQVRANSVLLMDEVDVFFTKEYYVTFRIRRRNNRWTSSHQRRNSQFRLSNIHAGFDPHSGQSWLFPVDFVTPDYLPLIVEKTLYHNSLVILPNRFEVSFVAAVVMHNVYRWYPFGKVVFICSNRKATQDQRAACDRLMKFVPSDVVDMALKPHERVRNWATKRAFFITSHTMAGEMARQEAERVGMRKIKLVVIEDPQLDVRAHSAIIQKLTEMGANFRVLCVTTTHGKTVEPAQLKQWHISNIELQWGNPQEKPDEWLMNKKEISNIVTVLGAVMDGLLAELQLLTQRYLANLHACKQIANTSLFETITADHIRQERTRYELSVLTGVVRKNHYEVMRNFHMAEKLVLAHRILARDGVVALMDYFHLQNDALGQADSELSAFCTCVNCSGSHEGLTAAVPNVRSSSSRGSRRHAKPPAWKKDKQTPAGATFTAADFPPLPSVGTEEKHPRPAGRSPDNTGAGAGATPKEDQGEPKLYSELELWSIYREYRVRLRQCKTPEEQIDVIAHLLTHGTRKWSSKTIILALIQSVN